MRVIQPGRNGGSCLEVSAESGADAGAQIQITVKPMSTYRFSGWIRTEAIEASATSGAAFNLHGRPEHTDPIRGTSAWRQVGFQVETGMDDMLSLNCLIGYFGQARGRAWFDDLSLQLVSETKLEPTVSIDLSKRREPISKYIYGQFIEHLGRCIYGGIWAEMLEDRKFFRAIGMQGSPWKAIRGKTTLTRQSPFSGEASLLLEQGMVRQSGIWLQKGREYVGYVWAKGDGGQVEIDGKTYSIKPSRDYAKTPFSFRASSDTKIGSIGLASPGQMVVGCASLMPADNIEGMRADVLKLLKQLDAPIYRWPGGNFVSGYEWRDGIGDRDRRPTRKNPAWQGIEPNDFGTHEYLRFCELIGTEPHIVVNTGFGDSFSGAQWVEYVNGAYTTPMGSLRYRNGHPQPWKVHWWGVGNEMFGDWQLGYMAVSQYALKHNDFVRRMKKIDPLIGIIGVGEIGGGWSKHMLENSADFMDHISEHFYCQERSSVLSHVQQIPNAIRSKVQAHREFRRTIPQLNGKDIRIAMDEWNYWYGPHVFGELGTRYFMKDALGIAAGLHEFFRHTDIVWLAQYAQTVNVIGAIKATPTHAWLESTGLVLLLYRREFGTIPVEVSGNPAPLDVSAALTADRKLLTLAIVNALPGKSSLKLNLSCATKMGVRWTIANPDPMAYNDSDAGQKVRIVEAMELPAKGKIDVAPYSVTLIRWEL